MIINRKNSIEALRKSVNASKSSDALKKRKKNVCKEGNLVYLDIEDRNKSAVEVGLSQSELSDQNHDQHRDQNLENRAQDLAETPQDMPVKPDIERDSSHEPNGKSDNKQDITDDTKEVNVEKVDDGHDDHDHNDVVNNQELFKTLIMGLDLINKITKAGDNKGVNKDESEESAQHKKLPVSEEAKEAIEDNKHFEEFSDEQLNKHLNDLVDIFSKNSFNIMLDYSAKKHITFEEYSNIHSLPFDKQLLIFVFVLRNYLSSEKKHYVDMGLRALNGMDFLNSVKSGDLTELVNIFMKK